MKFLPHYEVGPNTLEPVLDCHGPAVIKPGEKTHGFIQKKDLISGGQFLSKLNHLKRIVTPVRNPYGESNFSAVFPETCLDSLYIDYRVLGSQFHNGHCVLKEIFSGVKAADPAKAFSIEQSTAEV